MQFRVRWFDPAAAAVREETHDAASDAELSTRLAASGAVVLSVQRVAPGVRWPLRTLAAPELDVAWWCRELRTLLAAGMTVVEALETLHAQPLGAARAKVHAELVGHLRSGRALSAAMQAVGCFPPVLVASVKASERTSALVQALDDYLKHHELLDRLRKQVVSAAIYPALVMTLGGGIVVFLLLFVIPRFSRMYSGLHGPMSTATELLVAASRILSDHTTAVAATVALMLIAMVAAWQSGLLGRAGAWIVEAVPALRRYSDEFRLAKLYQSMALMFKGGYPLDEALAHCGGLGLGARMTAGTAQAQRALARGQRVSEALSGAGLTDSVSQRLLAVGERTGNFELVLQTIAARHSANFSTFVERATRLVEPVLLLAVALIVGGIVVMMYMPIFDIASSVR
jgi:general secretion pathway protein F